MSDGEQGRTPLMLLGAAAGMALVATVTALALSTAPAIAADGQPVSFTGALDEQSLTTIDANDPHPLDPDKGTVLSVSVRNDGSGPVEVRSVRLSATVLGLAFLNYTTRVDLVVLPGETKVRTFDLDLGDLGGQARGLLPGQVALLGTDRQVLAAQDVPVDVKGDLGSVYGVFGLGIGAITALLFLSLLVRLSASKLPANRWSRAWRFAIPGVGFGLTASLTLSVLRLLVPSPATSVALVVAGFLAGLAFGYLTPAPDDGTGREDVYEEDFAKEPAAVGARGDGDRLADRLFPPAPAAGELESEQAPTALGPSSSRPTQ